jgi:peptidoglycan/LPS O-acetylase OafA/YrhL
MALIRGARGSLSVYRGLHECERFPRDHDLVAAAPLEFEFTTVTMKKFNSIEGLRGWLAWTVVLCHITYPAAIYAKGWGPVFEKAGDQSVLIFIIISGFVITHLLIEKHETYGVYIFRRFMRIFPLFAVTCVIGYICLPFLLAALSRLPWRDATFTFEAVHSQTVYFWPNFLAHLTMMHGAISNNVLPRSQVVFNGPAWSLSLEWQFYLVAPLAVVAARRLSVALIAIGILTALCIAYDFGAFGSFDKRSLLFASAPFFAVGIASRIAYPKLARSLRNPAIVFALLIAQIPLGWGSAPFVIWGCVYAMLITDRKNLLPLDEAAMKIASLMLEGRFSRFMGTRSYSIYLCHMPVISLMLYALTSVFVDLSKTEVFLALLVTVPPVTFAFSCILYLTVEKPGVVLGNLISIRKIGAARLT